MHKFHVSHGVTFNIHQARGCKTLVLLCWRPTSQNDLDSGALHATFDRGVKSFCSSVVDTSTLVCFSCNSTRFQHGTLVAWSSWAAGTTGHNPSPKATIATYTASSNASALLSTSRTQHGISCSFSSPQLPRLHYAKTSSLPSPPLQRSTTTTQILPMQRSGVSITQMSSPCMLPVGRAADSQLGVCAQVLSSRLLRAPLTIALRRAITTATTTTTAATPQPYR